MTASTLDNLLTDARARLREERLCAPYRDSRYALSTLLDDLPCTDVVEMVPDSQERLMRRFCDIKRGWNPYDIARERETLYGSNLLSVQQPTAAALGVAEKEGTTDVIFRCDICREPVDPKALMFMGVSAQCPACVAKTLRLIGDIERDGDRSRLRQRGHAADESAASWWDVAVEFALIPARWMLDDNPRRDRIALLLIGLAFGLWVSWCWWSAPVGYWAQFVRGLRR